jgi:hypothetical protein
MNEIKTLGKFVRASRSNQFAQNEQALGIVQDAVKHYADLKRKAKKMISNRGYKEIFSAYDPAETTELDETIESVREVFVNSSIDSRIEEALPILAKIKENTMREADVFEDWTNQIMEGTWALPETEEDMAKLRELMSKPLPCGPDGEYASEQLYSLIGDDELFDNIGELADKDPDADCRELVKARAQELGVDIDVEVSESPTQEEPASGYQAGQANAAAGKERSLEMGMGGQDVVKTAGGSDIEEAEEELSMCCDAPIHDGDGDADGRCTSCGEVVRVEEGMDSFVNPNDQDATRSKTNVPTDDLDSEDMTEIEDIDTGKQALKAERDPMLERILYLAKG